MTPILAYSAFWHAQSNTGRLFLRLQDGRDVEVPADSPGELHAMIEMLRKNSNATWDEANGMLAIGWRKPGS